MALTAGSFKALMAAVDALEQAAIAQAQADLPELAIGYTRWQPDSAPSPLPHVCNWLMTSPTHVSDVAHLEDAWDLRCRVLIPSSDNPQRMAAIESYMDSFRQVLDPALFRQALPLGGQAKRTARQNAQLVTVRFGDAELTAIEFGITATVKRLIVQS